MISSRIALLIPNLGRDNDNEVLAAVRAIGAALRSGGHDFHDLAQVIEGLRLPKPPPPTTSCSTASPAWAGSWIARHRAGQAASDLDRANWLATYGAVYLTDNEKQFVHDLSRRLARYGGQATWRQANWLEALFNRVTKVAA